MYRKLIICMATVSLASVCFAQVKEVTPYVRVSGGLSLLNDSTVSVSGVGRIGDAEFDPGFVIGAAVGLSLKATDPSINPDVSIPLRIEAELLYQKNNLDKEQGTVSGQNASLSGDASMVSLMFNGYIDFKNKSIVTPYVLVGVGVARVDGSLKASVGSARGSVSGDDTVAAFQTGVGLGVAVSENISIDTEYRYHMTSDPDFGGVKADISGHRIQVGVRYAFN